KNALKNVIFVHILRLFLVQKKITKYRALHL
ncbi:MAG: hypothetical protein ACI85O_003930, partial [Saprospiraceae bacterium]